MQEYDCRMSGSDICMTFLLSSWALYCNNLELRHSVCEQSMKKSLSTFEDCMKSVHSIPLKNWQSNWADELECWAVHSYVLKLKSEQLSKPASHDWASYKQSWLCFNRSESLLFVSWVSHEASTTTWEVEACMICKKFSTESWSNCTKDERSHRVSTDDYDSHLADTERNSELEETAVLWLQERKQDLTKP